MFASGEFTKYEGVSVRVFCSQHVQGLDGFGILDHGNFDLEVRDLRLQFKIADAHRKGSGINDASLLWLFSNPRCSASPDRTSRDYDRNSLIERSVFVCQKEV